MKAVVCKQYGSFENLKISEIDKPLPGEGEVLVNVKAGAINFANIALVKGKPFIARFWSGLLKPKDIVQGGDIAGVVEAVGTNANQFQPGDEVYSDLSSCGFSGFAEYVTVPEKYLALRPSNISFEEASAVPQAALVALQALRDLGKIESGQEVLINGASGGIGTFAVQLAKYFGAEVTGVCSNRNLELVRSIGADHVIDYTQENFTKNTKQYDLILATAGYHSIFDYKRVLKEQGHYVSTGGEMAQIFQPMFLGALISKKGGKTLTGLYHQPSQDQLIEMKELIEAGNVKPVIEKVYPLEEVQAAYAHYDTGRTKGKIVVKIND